MRRHAGCGDYDPEQGATMKAYPLRYVEEEQRGYGAKGPQPLRGRPILGDYGVARRLRTAEGTRRFSLLVLSANLAFRLDAAF